MTALPAVPGIMEGVLTITPEPDGRISFRMLISADGKRTDCCGRVELIINPQHVGQALAETKIRRLAGPRTTDQLPTFSCHIGFSHNSVNMAPLQRPARHPPGPASALADRAREHGCRSGLSSHGVGGQCRASRPDHR